VVRYGQGALFRRETWGGRGILDRHGRREIKKRVSRKFDRKMKTVLAGVDDEARGREVL